MKKKKLKVKYISLWATATPKRKKEYQRRVNQAYDIIFEDISVLSFPNQINGNRETHKKSL